MPFVKGKPKTGGRKAGVPNKKTTEFKETLANLDFDIAKAAVELFRTSERDDIKLGALKLLAEYSQAKPKPVEQPTADGTEESADSDEDTDSLLRLAEST